ncbi:MAG: hypothetical protein M1827_006543 [Pycnora praestabilis]|nr:MAG: hypothetical protein M1827_006543 [Pycnora praestabilis]
MMYGSTLFRGFGTCTSLLVIAHNWQNAFAEGSSKNRPLFWRLNLPPGLPKNLPFCGDFLRQQNQIHNIKSRHFDGHIEEGEVDEIIREGDKSELAKRDGAMAASAIDRRVVALERLRKAISGRADTMHGADSSPLVQRSEKPPPPSLTCPNAPHGIRFDAGHFKNLSPVQVCSIAGCHCLLSGRVSCTRPKSRYWSWQDEVNEQMAPLCMKEYCYCVDATTGVKLDPPAQNGPNDDDPQMCIPGQEGDESCGEGGDCVAQSPKDAWTLWGVDPVIGIAVGACTYAMLRTFGGLIPGAINGVAAVIAHIVPDPDVAANAGAGQIVAGRGLLGEKLSGHEWGEGFPKVPEVLRGVA